MRSWVRSGILVPVLVAAVGLAACGDDGDSSGSGPSKSSKVAPEDLRASDADVAAGLADIKDISTSVADAVEAGSGDAKKLDDGIEPAWQPIEGTIKANDTDTYITFEDNFAVLSNAADDDDAGKARDAADLINTTADDYLAAYPG